MPGSFNTFFLLAFKLDAEGQPVPAFEPKLVPDQAAGLEEVEALRQRFAGVVLWKRQGAPAIGEEGEPEVLYTTGKVGDFN